MTREVYNLLTEVLDDLEKELKDTKGQSSRDETAKNLSPEIRIKVDINMNISIQ